MYFDHVLKIWNWSVHKYFAHGQLNLPAPVSLADKPKLSILRITDKSHGPCCYSIEATIACSLWQDAEITNDYKKHIHCIASINYGHLIAISFLYPLYFMEFVFLEAI